MTAIPLPILLQGIHGSPYTRKALGALRYRRLPYRFMIGQPAAGTDDSSPLVATLPVPKPVLLPTFYFPNDAGELEAVTDTTPILRRLETVSDERSVIPSDPVVAFLNYLLEDYADEWLTRCMFHFRWAFEADIDKAGAVLPFLSQPALPPEQAAGLKKAFSERQIQRLYVVGSNETTRSVIEESYSRFLQIMDAHLQQHSYLMGRRPGSADFAAFGQLTCLTHFDPTPMEITTRESPRVYAWTERLEDLCGIEVSEGDWMSRDDAAQALRPFLEEIARTHMPQLLANAKALAAGEKQFETTIDGKPWTQPSFPYQGKCLRWTREEFAALSEADQADARSILEAAGLLPLLDETIG